MGFLDDFLRGLRDAPEAQSAAGTGSGPWTRAPSGNGRQDDGAAFNGGTPDFSGDDLAEAKAVIAGLLNQLEQWKAAVAERDQYITALHAERDEACAARDRYQANGKRAAAQLDELQSIIAFPGARNALLKAVHPDTGMGGDIASRTAITQTLNAVLKRLGLGG